MFCNQTEKTNKNSKKKIEKYLGIDTFIVRGIQGTNLNNQVNPIYLNIGQSSNFNDFFIQYQNIRFIY